MCSPSTNLATQMASRVDVVAGCCKSTIGRVNMRLVRLGWGLLRHVAEGLEPTIFKEKILGQLGTGRTAQRGNVGGRERERIGVFYVCFFSATLSRGTRHLINSAT